MQFTCFIRKVFATTILLSRKFSLFLTLDGSLDPWDMGKMFGIRNIIVEESPRNLEFPHPWILSDLNALELLLTSGYVQEHKWLEAANLLTQIVDLDPEARTSSYRLNLAVSIALTFSSPVKSFASYDTTCIDPLARYQSFIRWSEEGVLFPVHASLSAWHLRYIVASWATDEELEWARDNVPEEFLSPPPLSLVRRSVLPTLLPSTRTPVER